MMQKAIFSRLSSLPRSRLARNPRWFSTSLPAFATVDPYSMSSGSPGIMQNLVDGKWTDTSQTRRVIDPLSGDAFLISPDTEVSELKPFVSSMSKVPRSGQHNIFRSPERFLMYGDVFRKAAEILLDPNVENYFIKTIQRVMPKSYEQAKGEVIVTRKFLENFSGDNVRMLMRGFVQAGDYTGQKSVGYRWPYGPVAVVSPFNFPLEIPALQFCAAAMVGNKPLIKPESHVALVVEQFIRLLHYSGLPPNEMDLIHCRGRVMNELFKLFNFRMTQFTGGASAAEAVTHTLSGKVRLEDSGFDWKVLGPIDPSYSKEQRQQLLDYVAWQCDQDAYAISGQKCSAQSVALMHTDWVKEGLISQMESLVKRRSLKDLTLSPLLSHTNEEIDQHLKDILGIPGSKLLFGGKALTGHTIPTEFGSYEPTAVLVDLKEIVKPEYFNIATRELFGPFQLIAQWSNEDEPLVIQFLSQMEALLTAGIVSNDPVFTGKILGATSNGTTYSGLRARTTGAPQNHWFGPCGSPLAAGIGSPEAILTTWTGHREIIYDEGPLPANWKLPPPS